MNGNPHLLAIIESKMAQVRTSLQNADPTRADDLLGQIRTYAASLDGHGPQDPVRPLG